MTEISASILNLEEENATKKMYNLETAKIDYFHIDVMDGKFVKNNNLELMKNYALTVSHISNLGIDVHLMVENVEEYVEEYLDLNPQISNDNILFEDLNIENNTDSSLMTYYKEKMDKANSRKQINSIIEQAKQEGIDIEDNTGWIATATRQCVNARIQGSAASLSKLAMIAIYNNKELRDLGFKTLYVIHDEIAGQCPKENAEKVAELLKKTMIDSAAEICSVKMKVDTYTISHWYYDDLSDTIKDKYDKLCKTMSPEEAFKKIDEENPEISLNVLRQMCDGTIDLTIDELAR